MTISTHEYSATLLLDVPYEVAPGYPETVYSWGFESYATLPSTQVYFQNFETNTTDGWAPSTGKLSNTLWGGSPLSQGQRSLTVGGNGTTTTPSFIRTFTGLTVGRSYTVSAIGCALAPSPTVTTGTIGVDGIGNSGNVNLTNTATNTAGYSFTATASSHVVRITTTNGGTGDLATWDNITLTANTYISNNGRDGFSSGTVGITRKRTGNYGALMNGAARAFTGLLIGHEYTLRGWRWDTGTSSWIQAGTTYTAASTSQSFSLPAGSYYWDDIELVHHAPPTMSYELPLNIKDGTVNVDVSRFNHVEASLTVPVTDSSKLANFDPRRKLRVRIDADATFPAFSQSRSFDLALRSARPNRATGDVDLRLASDESILQDFGPLANDKGARAFETSIRGVTNYVLAKIGANLQADTEDADVTAYYPVTNVLTDPAITNAANFTIAGNANTPIRTVEAGLPIPGAAYLFWTSVAAGQSFIRMPGTKPARAGEVWTFQAYMRRNTTSGPNGVLRIYEMDAASTILRQIESTPTVLSTTSAWTLLSLTFVVQNPKTTQLEAYTSGMPTGASQGYAMQGPVLFKGDETIPPFSGSGGGAGYTYSWQDTANASPSTRTPIFERPKELFTWRPGVGGVDFLSPILQSQGFRLVCDEERRWTLRRDGYRASGNLNLAYAVNVIGADEEITRESQDWFDAATYAYRWRAADGTEKSADDTYALPGYTKHVRRQIDREYPGPGRAQYAVQRAHNRGRTLAVETVANWDAKADQEVLVRLDGTPIQLGTADSIEWNLSTDRMRVTSRTADTPEGAIDLLPGTINALPGSINSLT